MLAGNVSFSSVVLPTKRIDNFLAPKPTASRTQKINGAASLRIKAVDSAADSDADAAGSAVDYSSLTSVFPAEACETIGGEACQVAAFPETRLDAPTNSPAGSTAVEECEREYLDYNQPKTVFLGEACDDLGGEFCGAEYQIGVCDG